jgi:hypothetical protein
LKIENHTAKSKILCFGQWDRMRHRRNIGHILKKNWGEMLQVSKKAFIFAAAKKELVVISGRRGVLDEKTVRLRSDP